MTNSEPITSDSIKAIAKEYDECREAGNVLRNSLNALNENSIPLTPFRMDAEKVSEITGVHIHGPAEEETMLVNNPEQVRNMLSKTNEYATTDLVRSCIDSVSKKHGVPGR